MKEILKGFLKKKLVLDTRSSWVYIGVLEEILDTCVVLSDVDVHDNESIRATKECYILDSKKTGIKSNRNKVYVNLDYVISFSPLEDVKYF